MLRTHGPLPLYAGGMPRIRNRTLVIDTLIAVVLGAATAVTTIPAADGDPGEPLADPLCFAIIGATALCLSFRRRWPLATLAAVCAGTAGYALLGYPYGPVFVLLAVAMGTVAAHYPIRVAIITFAVMIVVHLPYSIVADSDDDSPLINVVISVTWLALSTVTGVAFRRAREAKERALLEERRRYLSEERLLLAREVHDVVGHSLAAIGLHARVALRVLDRHDGDVPGEVTEGLTAIRDSGSAALEELRATLALAGPGEPPGRSMLTLANVETAAAALRSEDLRIDVSVDGHRGDIPAVVDGAGYRIVQESLTNVVKHAGASRARVDIGYAPGLVTVCVSDNGGGSAAGAPPGHGLAGMAERAAALGGGFASGPGGDGGFTVTAELPYAIIER